MGTLQHTGVLMSKAVYRVSDALSAKFESRIDPAQYDHPVYMVDLDYAAKEWTAQAKMGMGGFVGANAMLAISPSVSAGAEAFYLAQQKRSGVGLAVRATGVKSIASLQARSICFPHNRAWQELRYCASAGWVQHGVPL